MKYRQLGTERLRVSAIGLGCRPLTDLDGGKNEARANQVIHRAIDLGITLFDTADTYAMGLNEELLGKSIKGKRDQVVLADKFGITKNKPEAEGRPVDGRPEYVRAACEQCLRRLNTDVIDIYFLHRVDPEVPIEESVGAMKRLVEEGKVRYLGLSEAAPESIRRANTVHPIVVLQSEYSLWTRNYEKDSIPACRELGIGLMPYYPLGQGFLSGSFRGAHELDPRDSRKKMPRFQEENIGHNLDLLARFKQIADDNRCSVSQLALAWILAQADDFVPIPGTTSIAHLEENAGAADVELSAEDLARIERIFPREGSAAGARLTRERLVGLNI
ncbi:MAG: aldo/keto reductase [Deltaproteobacteria bacterium]|nr:aldo/keto reductase [Deltaproteobacteria bacterium]